MSTNANPANGGGGAEIDRLAGEINRKDTLPSGDYQASLYLHRLCERAKVDRDGIAEFKRQRVAVDHMLNVVGPVVRVLASFPVKGSFIPDSMGGAAFVIAAMRDDAETYLDDGEGGR